MHYDLDINKTLSTTGVFINRVEISDETSLHAHNFIEIAYVSEGIGHHIINDKTIPVRSGDIFIINYDIPHNFIRDEGQFVVYNCVFEPSFFDNMLVNSRNFNDIANHFLLGNFYQFSFIDFINAKIIGNDYFRFNNIFNLMLEEYTEKTIGYQAIIRGFLIEILILIYRATINISTNKNHAVYDSINFITQNYNTKISIKELAKKAHMSNTDFCRKFKAITGHTVTNFIQALRIEQACKLLSNTDKTVADIAVEIGYSDIKHFYATFKKIKGCLPKKYRH